MGPVAPPPGELDPPSGDCGFPGVDGGLTDGPRRGVGRGAVGRAVGRAPPELGAAPHQPALALWGDPSKVPRATAKLRLVVSRVFFMRSSHCVWCESAPSAMHLYATFAIVVPGRVFI